jgi:uncharacterized protein YigE (DUF2233 family)
MNGCNAISRNLPTAMTIWARFLALVALATPAAADTCATRSFEQTTYSVCEVHAGDDLRLFLNGADGVPLAGFDRVAKALEVEGRRLVFAMNAGMYHPDRSPVGLYVEKGETLRGLVTSDGPGNFGLLPNGVFCIGDSAFSVIESRRYATEKPACRFATQSGPMLVIGGALHPKFLAGSESLHYRNGVGVSADGQTAWFVISDAQVNFHAFARFFRDVLKVPDALYFDGNISRLYAPEIGRNDLGFPMGPMVGLAGPAD